MKSDNDKLEPTTQEQPFGVHQEKAILSLALDMPEFFTQVARHMLPKHFKKDHHKYVFTIIKQCFDKHGCVPTRDLVLDIARRNLTVDDDYEPVIETITRKTDYREVPLIKDELLNWTRKQAYGLLHSSEAHEALQNEDYEELDKIYAHAQRITDVTNSGVRFFDNLHLLWKGETAQKLTCGFPELDIHINHGGPARGEVFIWMAPTGRGKSIMLVNSGRMCVERNLKVLHVTLENSTEITMQRYMGSFTEENIGTRATRREPIEQRLKKIQASHPKGDLVIARFAPGEITTDTIHQLIDVLKRTKNWKPDVVIIDYLELMISRSPYNNRDNYLRQGCVAEEVRALAVNEDVLVVTATQTNREGLNSNGKEAATGGELIGINKTSESLKKMMSIDYCVTINQTQEERNCKIPKLRFWIAKNRNGPDEKLVHAYINYDNMRVKTGF